MTKIKDIIAKEILDARGFPALEVEVYLSSGASGKSIVPLQIPMVNHDSLQVIDKNTRYFSQSVRSAIENVNGKIKESVIKINPYDQKSIDQALCEYSENEPNILLNPMLAVSIANISACAKSAKKPLFALINEKFEDRNDKFYLPTPMVNVINGGINANNTISFQEFMLIPSGAQSFSDSLKYVVEIFYTLKNLLKKHGHNVNIGEEGGFSPNLRSNQEAIEYILLAIEKSSLSVGKDVFLGIDIAGNELYKRNKVFFFKKNYASIIETFMELTEKLVRDYPILSLEDPFCEKDFFSWKYLNSRIGDKIQLVGDDLFITKEKTLKKCIDSSLANAILIKVNQANTVSDAINVIKLAAKNGYSYIVSHFLGEVENDFIADFAIGSAASQVKFGSFCKGEGISKYNRLLRIEKALGKDAVYAGSSPFKKFLKV